MTSTNSITRQKQMWLALGAIFFTQPLWANACGMEEIDLYLQRGFTHEQVVKLCANPQPSTPSTQQEATTSPPDVTPSKAPSSLDKDVFYLQTVIDADRVEVTSAAIIYWRDKCYPYGTEGFTGFRPEACVNMRSTINRKGLEVVRAVKGIVLIRDQEMIVSGDIKRDILNAEKLKPRILETFILDYPASPEKLNIPVKKGIDPREVAETLKRLTLQ